MKLEAAALVLDAGEIAPDLRAVAPADADLVSTPELVSLWIKPGHYFNVFYRFVCRDGDTFGVSAHVLDPERGKRVVAAAGEHTCSRTKRIACRPCSTALTRPDVLVQAFPWDHRLPTLPRCTDPRQVRAAASDLDIQECDVRAYRPGMRCALRYRTAAGARIFGKVSVENRGRGYTFRTQGRIRDAILAAALPIRVPAPIVYVEELALTVVSELRGTSLHDLIAAGTSVESEVRAAASTLAALHGLPFVVEDRAFGASDELDLVTQWVELARVLAPSLATVLTEARGRLAAGVPGPGDAPSLLHRDFYDRQILFAADEPPAVLDLDTAAMGDRELDVANFCAHMRLRGLQFDRLDACLGWADAFVAAYPAPLDRHRCDWYRRSTLVRLACNYALRPRWRHIAAELAAAGLEG